MPSNITITKEIIRKFQGELAISNAESNMTLKVTFLDQDPQYNGKCFVELAGNRMLITKHEATQLAKVLSDWSSTDCCD